uniref:Uncharacterized protein n=1 Tax=Arundo donax TaxID=35708 RepID=A0A0A9BAC9_ARUDO
MAAIWYWSFTLPTTLHGVNALDTNQSINQALVYIVFDHVTEFH